MSREMTMKRLFSPLNYLLQHPIQLMNYGNFWTYQQQLKVDITLPRVFYMSPDKNGLRGK